jgi:hypothetical protein
VAHSPIVVTGRTATRLNAGACPDLPREFQAIDIAILEWIAAESYRAGRSSRWS